MIKLLFAFADVPHELWHSHTTVDAPETARYIRSIPGINISMPERTMWRLIVHKGLPPTRLMRYCCSSQKERGGEGRFVVTGVRWSESARRKNNRGSLEIQGSSAKNNLILHSDNDENRRLFETCKRKSKRILNPIVEWSDDDVWAFLDHYGCKSNPLYERGYKRVGCVGCPMTGKKNRIREFQEYPKYKENYIRAFDRMIKNNRMKKQCDYDSHNEWQSGEEVFEWWMREKAIPKEIEDQLYSGLKSKTFTNMKRCDIIKEWHIV